MLSEHKSLDRSMVMRSPCAGATLEPPLWIVPHKALSLSLSLSVSLCLSLSQAKERKKGSCSSQVLN